MNQIDSDVDSFASTGLDDVAPNILPNVDEFLVHNNVDTVVPSDSNDRDGDETETEYLEECQEALENGDMARHELFRRAFKLVHMLSSYIYIYYNFRFL